MVLAISLRNASSLQCWWACAAPSTLAMHGVELPLASWRHIKTLTQPSHAKKQWLILTAKSFILLASTKGCEAMFQQKKAEQPMKPLEGNYIMRIDSDPDAIEVVYLIYFDEKTGENVCFLPHDEERIIENYDFGTDLGREWVFLNDLIDASKPILKHQKAKYIDLKYICQLPNGMFGVKDGEYATEYPEFTNVVLYTPIALEEGVRVKNIAPYNYKAELKSQLETEVLSIPTHLNAVINEVTKAGSVATLLIKAKLHFLNAHSTKRVQGFDLKRDDGFVQ